MYKALGQIDSRILKEATLNGYVDNVRETNTRIFALETKLARLAEELEALPEAALQIESGPIFAQIASYAIAIRKVNAERVAWKNSIARICGHPKEWKPHERPPQQN